MTPAKGTSALLIKILDLTNDTCQGRTMNSHDEPKTPTAHDEFCHRFQDVICIKQLCTKIEAIRTHRNGGRSRRNARDSGFHESSPLSGEANAAQNITLGGGAKDFGHSQ